MAMLYVKRIFVLVALSANLALHSAQKNQNEDLLEMVNNIERLYEQCLKLGMDKQQAVHFVTLWQNTRYPGYSSAPNKPKESKKEKGKE